MGCCEKDKKVNDIEVEEIKEEAVEFEGPVAERSCRDVIFLIIFLAFLGGMGYVSFLGIHQGNPYRIVYGVDSWGNVCNQKNDKIEGVPLSGKDMSNRPKFNEISVFYRGHRSLHSEGSKDRDKPAAAIATAMFAKYNELAEEYHSYFEASHYACCCSFLPRVNNSHS